MNEAKIKSVVAEQSGTAAHEWEIVDVSECTELNAEGRRRGFDEVFLQNDKHSIRATAKVGARGNVFEVSVY